MKKKHSLQKSETVQLSVKKRDLYEDLRVMIEQARQSVTVAINSRLSTLYWKMGCRIRSEILQEKRAGWG